MFIFPAVLLHNRSVLYLINQSIDNTNENLTPTDSERLFVREPRSPGTRRGDANVLPGDTLLLQGHASDGPR